MIRPEQEKQARRIIDANMRRMSVELMKFCTDNNLNPWDVDVVVSTYNFLDEWWESTAKEAQQAAEDGL